MQKWEYTTVYCAGDRILKDYGEDGWELVAIYDARFYFKRPIAEHSLSVKALLNDMQGLSPDERLDKLEEWRKKVK